MSSLQDAARAISIATPMPYATALQGLRDRRRDLLAPAGGILTHDLTDLAFALDAGKPFAGPSGTAPIVPADSLLELCGLLYVSFSLEARVRVPRCGRAVTAAVDGSAKLGTAVLDVVDALDAQGAFAWADPVAADLDVLSRRVTAAQRDQLDATLAVVVPEAALAAPVGTRGLRFSFDTMRYCDEGGDFCSSDPVDEPDRFLYVDALGPAGEVLAEVGFGFGCFELARLLGRFGTVTVPLRS